MKIKKLMCFALALSLTVLALTACAKKAAASQIASEAADEASVEASAEAPAQSMEDGGIEEQLAAARLRVAELEALVEKYRPVYESQIVATYGDDGVIWKDAAVEQYNSAVNMYKQYGIAADSFAGEIKKDVLEGMVREAVLDAKAEELGLKELSEETLADLKAQAERVFNSYVEQYKSYFATDSSDNALSDEDAASATVAFLNQNGLTVDSLLTGLVKDHIIERLHATVTGDVTVSEEEARARYDGMVASAQAKYTDDRAYNNARAEGAVIAWNPEGYRAVKHVLIKFSDDQATRYNALNNTIGSLNAELAALDKPASKEEPARSSDVTTGEASESAAETRTREQIEGELNQANADMETLYAELEPRAREVIEAFNGGTSFDSLIEKYGEDPGMAAEPAKTRGYAVAEGSTYWEDAFTKGAMSIAEVGRISGPVRGSHGLHIIYYMSDITPGAVPFEEISEEVSKQALADKVAEVYNNQVSKWIEAAAPNYYIDRF